jgi:small multidrug resistance pump
MHWIFLALGIIFEVLGTICMKLAEGFTKLIPSIFVFIFYGISLVSLIYVLKKMDVSIAYAIWASLGIALISVIGVIWFKEPLTIIRVISILLIILGVLGLELFD